MYLGGKWYQLDISVAHSKNDPVAQLDVSCCKTNLIAPCSASPTHAR